jgi:nucleoside phosphorylase
LDKTRPTCKDARVIERWSDIDGRSQQILKVLLESNAAVSGRRVADVLKISPTTAGKGLKAMLDQGLVSAQPAGPALLWSANEANPDVRALRRDLESSTRAIGDRAPVPADALAWTLPPSGTKPALKVVVLTALPSEFAAVRSHFAETTLRRTRSGTRYDVGLLRGEHLDWEVYLAEVGMGNSGAAAEVAGAIEAFSPQLIIFVGVAGGLKPSDQRHGDVVVASSVYNVHSAKLAPHPDGGSQVLSRPLGIPAPHRLMQLVRAVARTTWAIDPLSGGQPQETATAQPAVHLRPIVAGEVVLADPDSDLRKLIAERLNDAAAIDMESHGVYETARRYDLPVLAVRGLSDLLGDKTPETDRELQPRAVANAAAFAIALLRHADEDDLSPGSPPTGPRGGGAPTPPSPPQGSQGGTAVPAAEESLARLAPTLRPWWRRLRARRGTIADVAVAELAGRSASSVGWLGRIRHRPPVWLRDDDSGDAWALVARFADAHGSPHATWLYDEAARRADHTGEEIISWVHRLRAALTAVSQPAVSPGGPDGQRTGDVGESPRAEALRRLSERSLLNLAPLTAVLRAAVEEDIDAILAASPAAAHALGLSSEHLMRVDQPSSPRRPDEDIEQAVALFAELAETDPDVVDQLRGELLVMIAYALLTRSDVFSALAVFTEAREFIPAAAAPLLGMARARLHRVGGPGAMADATIELSSELAEAEELALLARDRWRTWNADSGEAVAIAVRARADRDPHGALRLVLAAPRGVATDAEARDPRVREAGAVAAVYAGEHLLGAELAASISDPVERDLVRAIALTQVPNVGDEAEQALRRALQAAPATRPDQLVRALLGLVQLGAPILPDQPGTVAPELARLRDADAEAADMVEATAALRSGQPRQALVIARQYPTSIPAVEIAAQAAAAAGDPGEALRILERAGRARGDEMLRTQAMFLAADAGLEEEAQRLATQLVLSRDAETRRRALEVQLTLAERGSRWEEVADLGRRLLDDNTLNVSDVRRDQHVIGYRWAVAGAEFSLRRPPRARKALDEPDLLEPRNPPEAMLLLAVLRASAVPSAQDGTPAPDPTLGQAMLERALAAAAAFPDDEDVLAAALKIVLTCPAPAPLPDALLARVRALQEDFFNRVPDSAHLRRITVGDDLSGLVEHLRETFAPGAEQVADLARQVWLGLCPQGLLADVTGRSYAETLIKRVVGCLVASAADPVLADTEQSEAGAAREAGSVVVDTSTLVLLDALGGRAQRLTAEFGRLLFPASCRDDVLEARNGLALRSTGTLGWNRQRQRPQATEIPPEVVDNWAEAGARLAQRLALVEVVPGVQRERDWSWDASLLLAHREGVALWADDLALRHAARSQGVPAFGTLELVTDLVKAGQLPRSVLDEVVEAFRRAYVVDLPLADRLSELAAAERWQPEGYAALLLARPRLWSQPADGFAQFTRLVRTLPPADATPDVIVGWAAAAMTGLAWAIPPPARPRAVAALVAWTVLNAGGEHIFPKVLDAGENVMAAAAPAGDLLAHTVSVLAETLNSIVPAGQVGVLFTHLLANLDQQRRTRAMQAFLSLSR